MISFFNVCFQGILQILTVTVNSFKISHKHSAPLSGELSPTLSCGHPVLRHDENRCLRQILTLNTTWREGHPHANLLWWRGIEKTALSSGVLMFAYEAWVCWGLYTLSSSLSTGLLERVLDSFEGTTLCLDFLIKMKTILSYGFASFMICSILAPSRMVICCFPISHVDCDFLLWSGHNGYRSGKEGLLK